jgi:hypothetical protein
MFGHKILKFSGRCGLFIGNRVYYCRITGVLCRKYSNSTDKLEGFVGGLQA